MKNIGQTTANLDLIRSGRFRVKIGPWSELFNHEALKKTCSDICGKCNYWIYTPRTQLTSILEGQMLEIIHQRYWRNGVESLGVWHHSPI